MFNQFRSHPEADLPGALRDLAAGRMDRSTFLERFGHRGSHEMELASRRWYEDPAELDHLMQTPAPDGDSRTQDLAAACARIADEAKWTGQRRKDLMEGLNKAILLLHTLLGLREAAKHYWMQGSLSLLSSANLEGLIHGYVSENLVV